MDTDYPGIKADITRIDQISRYAVDRRLLRRHGSCSPHAASQPPPLHRPSTRPADRHDPALLGLVSGGRRLLRHGSRLTQPPPLHRPSARPADPRDPALLTLVSGDQRLLRHGSRLTQPPPLSAPPADPRDPVLLTLTFSWGISGWYLNSSWYK
ncbi:hypothetical protein E2562_008319 [Oryza meyeriana var. granulata]|uniref:Uncharacterized protein n=1 Tax=Oryza meyeriana var. granulata TaxID=110450 RepID=A0A6G1DGA2_9ORYZ|nr:hypothetical protein E2562_008319 [Oryza meyeriana var. granulata]